MLVSCFGYLGYKNARFGRIEAHESVNAFSRDIILTAKEIAESRGYRLLHGIIDCVWLKKPGATQSDYEELAREISARVGIDISLVGIYNWILFPLPNRSDDHHSESLRRLVQARRFEKCAASRHGATTREVHQEYAKSNAG